IQQAEFAPLPEDALERARAELSHFLNGDGSEPAAAIRADLQKTMMDLASVLRTGSGLQQCVDQIRSLEERFRWVRPLDRSDHFNTDLLEVVETGYLLDLAEAVDVSALNRTESRGAHFREDFPERNDAEWLKDTLTYREEGKIVFRYKPVT